MGVTNFIVFSYLVSKYIQPLLAGFPSPASAGRDGEGRAPLLLQLPDEGGLIAHDLPPRRHRPRGGPQAKATPFTGGGILSGKIDFGKISAREMFLNSLKMGENSQGLEG